MVMMKEEEEKKKQKKARSSGSRFLLESPRLSLIFPRRQKLRFGASITQSWGRTVVLFCFALFACAAGEGPMVEIR